MKPSKIRLVIPRDAHTHTNTCTTLGPSKKSCIMPSILSHVKAYEYLYLVITYIMYICGCLFLLTLICFIEFQITTILNKFSL